MNAPIADVLGDVALVLVISALFGALARRLGQPTVVGQIVAGVLLGPSALGHLPGHVMSRLFPQATADYLNVLAQVAVVIFMFSVGYELEWPSRHSRGWTPLAVAVSALLVPMLLGAGIVFVDKSGFAAVGQPHITRSFIYFMAVALSITALPVLAAIVRERGIADTIPSATATSAAGLMDAAAWLVLVAALTGSTDKPARPWLATLALFGAFILVMFLAVRPVLRWWFGRPGAVLSSMFPVALMLAMGSAWVTTSLGVHPVFGGFIAGVAMPRMNAAPDAEVVSRAEDIGGFLLPLFFIVTGRAVNVDSLNGSAFSLLAVLCAIAVLGKVCPAYMAARMGGLTSREASTVAVLVNTRGLTELIALDVGLQAGIIGSRLFTILVLMALMTTIATVPLLRVVVGRSEEHPIRAIADDGATGVSSDGQRPDPADLG